MGVFALRAVEMGPEKISEASVADLPTFGDFWLLYPKRVAKRDAERAWMRLSADDQVAALTALVDWRRLWMARNEMQYVPHPATWLNGGRWEDELPEQWAGRPASMSPAKLPAEQFVKSEMPAHVREALAKLRGR